MTATLPELPVDYLQRRQKQTYSATVYCALVKAFGISDDYPSHAKFNYEWPERSNAYEFSTSWGQDGILIYRGPDRSPFVQLLPMFSEEAQDNVNAVLKKISDEWI